MGYRRSGCSSGHLYKNGSKLNVPKKQLELSRVYCNRAKILGLRVDDKFRNLAGLKLQLIGIVTHDDIWARNNIFNVHDLL